MSAVARGGLDRRAFLVDGMPLNHWSKDNFEPERDESCRVVFVPKEGPTFFRNTLRTEDYILMRNNHSVMEQPFFSKYNRYFPKQGHFCCKGCGNPLYSHKTKLKREDGWPAFGACVDGAIGMTTAEDRRVQEERNGAAAVRIQAFFRGCMGRAKVSEQIGKLIEKVMELQREVENDEEHEMEEQGDVVADIPRPMPKNSVRPLSILSNHWSVHLLDSSDEDSSSSSLASLFGDDDDLDPVIKQPEKSTPPTSNESRIPSRKDIAASAANAALKRSLLESETKGSLLMSGFNELLVEIHCHRCKSHLGNVYEETNRGQDGVTKYKERHQVNGRALKYVEDDLPKRTRIDGSLLFASTTQARLLGVKAAVPNRPEPEFVQQAARTQRQQLSFVSPLSLKKKNITLGNRPGVGAVTFQSPERAPKKTLTQNQKEIHKFFLSRSVH